MAVTGLRIANEDDDSRGTIKVAMNNMIVKDLNIKPQIKASHKLGAETCLLALDGRPKKIMENKHKPKRKYFTID